MITQQIFFHESCQNLRPKFEVGPAGIQSQGENSKNIQYTAFFRAKISPIISV
jgi:hypothetical protein